jgi:hypothetical protein
MSTDLSSDAVSSVQIQGKTFVPLGECRAASAIRYSECAIEENDNQNEVIQPQSKLRVADETRDPKCDIPLVGGIKGEKLDDEEIAMYIHAFVILFVAGLFYGVGRGIAAVANFVG